MHYYAKVLFPTSLFSFRIGYINSLCVVIARETRAPVLAISELWIDSSVADSKIQIEEYFILWKDCNHHGSGFNMFIYSDTVFNPYSDLDDNNVEAIWCDLLYTFLNQVQS